MSLSQQDVQSIYGLINAASDKDPDKLIYRTLHLPKNAPEAVYNIEAPNIIMDTLPEGIQRALKSLINVHKKALISTTSINSGMMNMLTTNRQRIEVNNPLARKSFADKLLKRGPEPDQQ